MLNADTFVVFGAVMLGPALGDATGPIAALRGAQPDRRPHPSRRRSRCSEPGRAGRRSASSAGSARRGLASIVFAVIIIEDGGLPHENVLVTTAVVTVGLSVLAHGLTAAPLADRYADWYESHPRDELPALESRDTTHVPWRRH